MTPHTVAAHLENDCPLRPIACKHACGRVQAQALITLHEPTCDFCPTECRLGCGIDGLILKTREKHEVEDCPERLVTCMDCREV